MQKLSRRTLARYAADQLLANQSPKKVAEQLGAVLVASKRAGQAGQLIEDIAYELENRGVMALAEIASATKLDDKLKAELEKFIKKAAAVDQVEIEERVDESLIGGVRIETAKRSFDQTIKRRLTDIREAF
jgi:F-type H+-transporting ATPase subunit delta